MPDTVSCIREKLHGTKERCRNCGRGRCRTAAMASCIQLTRKPLIMDMLIIKKTKDYQCRNPIAEFFRKHNIIEYKNPQESYGINDLCRPLAYAGIYRADSDKHFPLQFIINTQLDPERYKWLSRLRHNLTLEKDVDVLAKEYWGKEKVPLYETAMDVIMRANKEVFKEAKSMCQALRELFADELVESENRGISKGIGQGENQLARLVFYLLTDGQIDDIPQAASDEKFRRKCYQEYGMVNCGTIS